MFKSPKLPISAVLFLWLAAAVLGCVRPCPYPASNAATTTETSTVESTDKESAEQEPAPEEETLPAQ